MLTDAQLNHIRERLLEERGRALGEINRSQATAAEGEFESAGDISGADEGTEKGDEDLAATLAEREIGEIAEIDAALERLYKHPRDFGRCERTGRDIPLARLELVPWARTC
jgi:DnaK suppressor protein